jgi:hypothetical protein
MSKSRRAEAFRRFRGFWGEEAPRIAMGGRVAPAMADPRLGRRCTNVKWRLTFVRHVSGDLSGMLAVAGLTPLLPPCHSLRP